MQLFEWYPDLGEGEGPLWCPDRAQRNTRAFTHKAFRKGCAMVALVSVGLDRAWLMVELDRS
jgi:hypothetical protein